MLVQPPEKCPQRKAKKREKGDIYRQNNHEPSNRDTILFAWRQCLLSLSTTAVKSHAAATQSAVALAVRHGNSGTEPSSGEVASTSSVESNFFKMVASAVMTAEHLNMSP